MRPVWLVSWIAAAGLAACLGADASAPAPRLTGSVTDAAGTALAGAFITVQPAGAVHTHTRITDSRGRFAFDELEAGTYTLTAHRPGLTTFTDALTVPATGGAIRDIVLEPGEVTPADVSSGSFLALLPDGPEKRRFMLDCTGCHVLDARIALLEGRPRTAAEWAEATERMLGYAGASTAFPVIAHDREAAATAAYLAAHLGGEAGTLPPLAPPVVPDPTTAGALITEYAIPEPEDLPHDLAIDATGRILITGMFTNRLYVLDPTTARFDTIAIPVTNANPRAIEVAADGSWWVLLGAPMRVARYDPASAGWQSFDIGMYGHSIGIDREGRAWSNGHFTRDPIVLGYVEPASGELETFEAPANPMVATGGNPIPYELRIAPDGTVWTSELTGNRVVALEPTSRTFRVHTMPTPHSGPRRIDVASDGSVWIPEYANNALARLDPVTGAIREWPLPLPDAAPYVARVDPRSGIVWIGTGAADALLAFDPATERFTIYRLPTRGALVRHLAVDPRNGEVWAAYGASPGIPARVARLRPPAPVR